MSKKKPAVPSFNLGDLVKVHLSAGLRGRIVELRGPLGPGGAQIYRVQIRNKPKPAFIELREDQLEMVPVDEEDKPRRTKKPLPT